MLTIRQLSSSEVRWHKQKASLALLLPVGWARGESGGDGGSAADFHLPDLGKQEN